MAPMRRGSAANTRVDSAAVAAAVAMNTRLFMAALPQMPVASILMMRTVGTVSAPVE